MITIRNLVTVLICISITSCTADKYKLEGSYSGILPCADCPGIEYSLHLNTDGSFTEKKFYIDRDTSLRSSEGTYTMTSDSLITLNETDPPVTFRLLEDQLQLVAEDGAPFRTGMPELYMLQKERTASRTPDKEARYVLSGNEPFWSLEIIPESLIRLNRMSREAQAYPYSEPVLSEIGRITRWHTSDQNRDLHITLIEMPCRDTMAGFRYPWRASVILQPEDGNTVRLSGCAKDVRDEPLEGKWKISIYGLDWNGSGNADNHPYLNFQYESSRVTGFAGCNDLNGTYSKDGFRLSFSEMAVTRKMCADMSFEDSLLQLLPGNTFHYGYYRNTIILQNEQTLIRLFKD